MSDTQRFLSRQEQQEEIGLLGEEQGRQAGGGRGGEVKFCTVETLTLTKERSGFCPCLPGGDL